MTRIAINGSKGKMGQTLIEAINSTSQSEFGAGFDKGDSLIDSISNFEVLIDFSRPEASLSCLLYTSPSPRDRTRSRMPSSA